MLFCILNLEMLLYGYATWSRLGRVAQIRSGSIFYKHEQSEYFVSYIIDNIDDIWERKSKKCVEKRKPFTMTMS